MTKPTDEVPNLQQKEVGFRPSVFYRREHPDYFSDTTEVAEPELPKDLLLFHLDQLTATKKEREFEDFCRRLCEHEICPNLLPQTGPVGGGDSKTESSTYPVSPELAQYRWWIGHTLPTQEDWAFAFSAKRDWRTKVKDDVAKIASLPRRFTRAYFITNQAVKDKARALTTKHGLDIRILDRNWIAERVATNHHERLAVQALALQVSVPRERRQGPRDTRRTEDLEGLLSKLRKSKPSKADEYAQSQEYLRAAKLASSLERPRDEVDGLFLRARELAIESGHVPAIIRTHYQYAWRSHFWYDDTGTTERILEVMLPYLPGLQDAELCELFNNLCWILETASAAGFYSVEPDVLQSRRDRVTTELKRLANDYSRPNNALYAETIIASSGLRHSVNKPEAMKKLFEQLRVLFQRAERLGAYPMLQFLEMWERMGQFFCDWPGYAELQHEMQRITAQRFGDTEAGRRQLSYGWQLLDKRKHADALKELSQARFLLAKEETLDESIDASLGCAIAYRALGHFWAARMEAVSAAHASLYSIERFHENPDRGLFILMLIAWFEVALGRIAPFLAWHHFAKILLPRVAKFGFDTTTQHEQLQLQDGCLACLLLKVPPGEVQELRDLVDVFDRVGLFMSRVALLYVCGDTQRIRDELPDEIKRVEPDSPEEMISGLKKQPAFDEAPSKLCRETRAVSSFEATLLGITFRVRCRNRIGPIFIAESVLGMIDAAFATARWENFAFIVDEVRLFIDETNDGRNPPSLEPIQHTVLDEINQTWRVDVVKWIHDHYNEFEEYLHMLSATLITATTMDPWEDLKNELGQWKNTGVFNRALIAARNSIAFSDLLGTERYDVNYWIKAAASSEI
ncbi:MAG: hypothetical protein ACREIF_16260 [Chthoniobacterales bacterium]